MGQSKGFAAMPLAAGSGRRAALMSHFGPLHNAKTVGRRGEALGMEFPPLQLLRQLFPRVTGKHSTKPEQPGDGEAGHWLRAGLLGDITGKVLGGVVGREENKGGCSAAVAAEGSGAESTKGIRSR